MALMGHHTSVSHQKLMIDQTCNIIVKYIFNNQSFVYFLKVLC